MEKSKVYFIREITPENVVKLYDMLGIQLKGKVAVKVHTGEAGNQNYIRPEFWKQIVEHVNGTIVECNTAYPGERDTTEKHLKLVADHGWTKYFNVELMDASGDFKIDIPNGQVIKQNILGNGIKNFDSMLVLSHFKGHPMGGYGGALKQLSIGCASSAGKAYIHSAGKTTDPQKLWENIAEQDKFLEAMADAASSVVNMFKNKIAFINVMKNISVDCDCCAVAEDPCMKDIGILASLDPIAVDRACLDLALNSTDAGRDHFAERVESRNGEHIIVSADKLDFGTSEYQLVEVK